MAIRLFFLPFLSIFCSILSGSGALGKDGKPYGPFLTVGKLPQRLVGYIRYFDRIDVEERLNDRQFVERQVKCLIYGGKCDNFGSRARALLPSVILDNCRLCTNSQKNKLARIVVFLQQNYPGAWRDALVKFGGAPKFITAGHVAPQIAFLGGTQNSERREAHSVDAQTPYDLNPVLPTPQSLSDYNLEASRIIFMPSNVYFQPSTAPEPIPAVESPSPVMTEPTNSPTGIGQASSAQPPSTPVVESTIELKPTTLEPYTVQPE